MIDAEKKTQIARVLLTKTGRGSKVSIDGVEIRNVCCVSIEGSPSEIPTVTLKFLPDVIDVEAEGEVTLSPAKHVAEPMASVG